jgi:hypothetical protein
VLLLRRAVVEMLLDSPNQRAQISYFRRQENACVLASRGFPASIQRGEVVYVECQNRAPIACSVIQLVRVRNSPVAPAYSVATDYVVTTCL